jgi:DNA repair exonuclease SbcCD ATPase subunit
VPHRTTPQERLNEDLALARDRLTRRRHLDERLSQVRGRLAALDRAAPPGTRGAEAHDDPDRGEAGGLGGLFGAWLGAEPGAPRDIRDLLHANRARASRRMIEQEIATLEETRRALADAEAVYAEALRKKEQWLLANDPEAGPRLAALAAEGEALAAARARLARPESYARWADQTLRAVEASLRDEAARVGTEDEEEEWERPLADLAVVAQQILDRLAEECEDLAAGGDGPPSDAPLPRFARAFRAALAVSRELQAGLEAALNAVVEAQVALARTAAWIADRARAADARAVEVALERRRILEA